MQLTKPNPSPELRQAFVTGLPMYLRGLGVKGDVSDILNLPFPYEPLQVHTLRLRDLTGNRGAVAMRKVGWRFLAGTSGEPLAAEVAEPPFNRPPKMIGLSHGDQVLEFLKAAIGLVTILANQPNVLDSYELRTLTVPGLLIEAFWLKSPTGTQDLVVPYRIAKELTSKQVFAMEDFLSFIQPLAKDRLQYDD